ncbi:unnamed protein product, partial [marine sediment metagenome]
MEAAGKRYLVYSDPNAAFRMWNVADTHLGNKGVAVGRLKADLEIIKDDPYSFWVGGGDYGDYIGIGDKRFDPEAIAEWMLVKDLGKLGAKLSARAIEMFKPIKHKCAGIVQGNHDRMYEIRSDQQGMTEKIAKKLGVRMMGYCAFFDLVFIYSPNSKGCPKMVCKSDAPKGQKRWTVRTFI